MLKESAYFNEDILIRELKEGSPAAFKFVYDSLNRPLRHFIMRFVKNEAKTEDIIQDTFVIFWQRKNQFTSSKQITAYIYTVAKNDSLDHLKHVKVISMSEKEIAFLGEMAEPVAVVKAMKEDLIQLSIIAASNLPEKMKKVFELLYIEGFTTSETAEKLGLPVHTVRVQRANSIKRIREILIKQGLLGALSLLTYLESSQN